MRPIEVMLVRPATAPVILWTPADLAVPASIRCDHTTAMTVTGANISAWADGSGNGYNFSAPSSTNNPDYLAADINGYPAAGPTNASQSDYMTATPTGLYQAASQGWIMCIYKMRGSGTTNRILGAANTATAGAARFWLQSDSTAAAGKPQLRVRRLDADGAATLTAATAINDGAYHMVLGTMDWSTRAAAIYIDGASDATNATLTSATGTTSNTASSMISVMGNGGSTTDSVMAGILFGTTLPDSTEIDKLFGYYAHQLGLQSLLPIGHPYKASPPTP